MRSSPAIPFLDSHSKSRASLPIPLLIHLAVPNVGVTGAGFPTFGRGLTSSAGLRGGRASFVGQVDVGTGMRTKRFKPFGTALRH